MRSTLCLLSVIVAAPATSESLAGQQDPKTFAGLTGFRVVVEDLDDDSRASGLSKDALRTKIELALRRTGIVVLPDTAAWSPIVYLNLNLLPHENSTFFAWTFSLRAYAMSVRRDKVVAVEARLQGQKDSSGRPSWLLHDAALASLLNEPYAGTIWEVPSHLGYTSRATVYSHVMQLLQEDLDELANAWLTANPKR